MENLLLNDDFMVELQNEFENIITNKNYDVFNGMEEEDKEDFIWDLIGTFNWYSLTKDYGFDANEKLKEILIDVNNTVLIKEMKNFIIDKREALKEKVGADVFIGSDDTFWDVTSHIVGMGKTMYEFAMNNPEVVNFVAMKKDYMENFEYAFDAASFEMDEESELEENEE